jgi:hypothetical protein
MPEDKAFFTSNNSCDRTQNRYFIFLVDKRGVAIFAKACFGHPSPSKRQKLNATANAFGAPIRPRHLVPTQQGVGTLAPNDLTPCRMAFYFVSTFAIAQTPTKQPALRLSRTKNLHFAKATFPGFSALDILGTMINTDF